MTQVARYGLICLLISTWIPIKAEKAMKLLPGMFTAIYCVYETMEIEN